MNNNLHKMIKNEQEYRLLLRHLRKKKEKNYNEKIDNNETYSNQPK